MNMNSITSAATVEYMRIRIEALEKELSKKDLQIELLIEKIKKLEIDRDIKDYNNGKRDTQD